MNKQKNILWRIISIISTVMSILLFPEKYQETDDTIVESL